MRSSSIGFLFLFVGLLLGGGLGFVLGSGSGPESPRRAAPEDDGVGRDVVRAAEREAPRSTPSLAAVSGPESLAGLVERPKSSAQAKNAARSVVSRVDASGTEAAAEHDGVIVGNVCDAEGMPLSGATVVSGGRARWYEPGVSGSKTDKLGRGWNAPDSLEQELERYAEQRIKARAKLSPATVDENGEFRIEGLEAGTHSIQAYMEGYFFEAVRAVTGSHASLIGRRVGEFHLDIIGPGGESIDEAVVMVPGKYDREEALEWSRENPVVRIGSRAAQMRVLAGDVIAFDYQKHTARLASPVRLVDLDKDGDGPHVFELETTDQLRVTLNDPTMDGPRMEAWVKVKLQGKKGGEQKLNRRGSGPFVATALQTGTYELTAGRGSETAEITQTIEVSAGTNEITLDLPALDPSRFIIAECRTADGRAVAGVTFMYSVERSGAGSNSGGTEATQRFPGVYWLDISQMSENISGANVEVWITAKSPQHGSLRLQANLDGEPTAFEFHEPCALTVEVARGDGERFRVEVRPADNGEDAWMYHQSRKAVGPDGRLDYGYIQPGRVRISLYPAKDNYWGAALFSEETTLPSGPHVFRMAKPEMHELVVHAPDLEPGSRVQVNKPGDDNNWQHVAQVQLDDSRRATFSNLAPGRYRVVAWGSGVNRQMEVDVPCGEVLLEDQPVRGYSVTQIQKGKLADRAGLENGDIIVAVGDHLASESTFNQRLWLELAEGETVLSIERGGQRLTVTVEAVSHGKQAWTELGASVQPRY